MVVPVDHSLRPPLKTVYQNKDRVDIDIVAVHGLGSDGDWSWTWKDPSNPSKQVRWLEDIDMLPRVLPTSRISLYNYESIWHLNAPKTTLEDCGRELVRSVLEFHRNHSRRPVVYIGHSLGGLVIQHAFLFARSDGEYNDFEKSAAGLLFLGSPFYGSELGYLPQRIAKVMKSFGSHDGIIKELSHKNPTLRKKANEFCRICKTLSIPVMCCFELYTTDVARGIIPYKAMIVEETSACLPGMEHMSLEVDHSKLNKFPGPTNSAFLAVSGALHKMCAAVVDGPKHDLLTQTPDAQECMRDLFLTDPLEDKNNQKRKKGPRATDTCTWIINTPVITSWLHSADDFHVSNREILWLYGNPGVGKSTMAIFLVEHLSKTFATTPRESLVYFFCDSSIVERRTCTSILRSFILQLLRQMPSLLRHLLPKYKQRGSSLFSSFDALWTIFLDMVADETGGKFFCIIDALDECERDSQDTILHYIKEEFGSSRRLTKSPNAHILITSRPYRTIRESLGQFENKDLASFEEMSRDIDKFIEEKVVHLKYKKAYSAKLTDQVSHLLRDRAEGTFLWIGLACKELATVPSKDALNRLNSLPKGLHSLYQDIIEVAIRECKQGQTSIAIILTIVTISQRPMNLLELSYACNLNTKEDDDETRIQYMRDEVESCHLMMVVQDDTVSLLHQSVRDFLVSSRGDGLVDVDVHKAHASLTYRCVDYLLSYFHKGSLQKKPLSTDFLSYSAQFWPEHARLAEAEFEVISSHADFFKPLSKCRENWLEYYRKSSYIPQGFSIFHVAAHWGIPTLVKFGLRQDSGDEENPSLRQEISSYIDRNYMDWKDETPLKTAMFRGHTSVVACMLSLLPIGMLLDRQYISMALGNGNVNTVRLMLDHYGDHVSIRGEMITAAAGNGSHAREVLLLLFDEHGEDITIPDEAYEVATGNYGRGSIQLLLERRPVPVRVTTAMVKAIAPMLRYPDWYLLWSQKELDWSQQDQDFIKLLVDGKGQHIDVTAEAASLIAQYYDGEIMALLLGQIAHQGFITIDLLRAAAENQRDHKVLSLLLEHSQNNISITEEVVLASAGNPVKGSETMSVLVDARAAGVPITEDILLAAVRNQKCGTQIMKTLFNRGRAQFIISEKVLEAAARNTRELMVLLLQHGPHEIAITQKMIHIAAECSVDACRLVPLLLDQRGGLILASSEVIRCAARNTIQPNGLITLLLNREGESLMITEELMVSVVENHRIEQETIRRLLSYKGTANAITESVVRASMRTDEPNKEVIMLLLNKINNKTIIPSLLRDMAEGIRYRPEILAMMFEQLGKHAIITEDLMVDMLDNCSNGAEVMGILFDNLGSDIPITEAVVKSAARNGPWGSEIIHLLYEERRGSIPFSQEIVEAAAGNKGKGREVIDILLKNHGHEIIFTREVAESACGNEWRGEEIIEALLNWNDGQVALTADAILTIVAKSQTRVVKLLLDRKGEQIAITPGLVTAAARNPRNGREVIDLLLDREAERLPVSEEMILAAAWNSGDNGWAIIYTILSQRKDRVPIAKMVVHYVRKVVAGSTHTKAERRRFLKILSTSFIFLSKYKEAQATCREELALAETELGPTNEVTLSAADWLCFVLFNLRKYDEAEELQRRTLELRMNSCGEGKAETFNGMFTLGKILLRKRKHEAAYKTLQEAWELSLRLDGTNDLDTISLRGIVGFSLYRLGRYSEAESFVRQTLEQTETMFGREGEQTVYTMQLLSGCLFFNGKYGDAVAYAIPAFWK